MRIAGLRMTDLWADRVLRERGIETTRLSEQPCLLNVMVEQVLLTHHGQDRNYRPYLHLSGELRSVVPVAGTPWPYGVRELVFSPGLGERVDAFYEFDDQQLSELVGKGYFRPGFDVPAEVSGIEWELPATADTLLVAPEENGDVPVVFVHVHEASSLETDLDASGYDLAEYFRDHGPQEIAAPDTTAHGPKTRSDELHSLFTDDPLPGLFDNPEASRAQRSGRTWPAEDDNDLEHQIQEHAQLLADEREEARRQREEQAGTLENLYRDKIRARLPQGDEPTPAAAPETSGVDTAAAEATEPSRPAQMIRQDGAPGDATDREGGDLEF